MSLCNMRLGGNVFVMDRLKVLVFSFYREDEKIRLLLTPLHSTRMSREMGNIHIECLDARHLDEVIPLANYLKTPIELLKLGRNIVFQSVNCPNWKYSINVELDKNLYV